MMISEVNETTFTPARESTPKAMAKAARSLVERLRAEGSYRYFLPLHRENEGYPYAFMRSADELRRINVFCSNDYLGMSRHPVVLDAAEQTLSQCGLGSGGSRNISGTTTYHVALEREMASLHKKEAALLFSTGYVANEETLGALSKIMPDLILLSDGKNHRSLIEGIRKSGLSKIIFEHNSIKDLESKLQALPHDAPKMIVLESVYSMDGHVSPLADVVRLKHRYNAMIYLDEIHGVGVFGEGGAGVADEYGVAEEIDLIQGGFGKAYGGTGGYVAGNAELIDAIRLVAPGFIFTTSLPPMLLAGNLASVRHLRQSNTEREKLFRNAALLKKELQQRELPVMDSPSHIVPVLIGDSFKCKRICDRLIDEHGMYVQPINFPSVNKGQERLRVIVSSEHSPDDIRAFADALADVMSNLTHTHAS
ncbi:5-aminolevulinate synthase [Archangium sp.]|uniref:5-aminolevulinate synthase n=1 Tax=Archangium sp. TaxID=1872627 RepID=UPI002D46017F|nr:5-aminolevulinate synthase [Archangium sp.]HYO56252.1 5-aminolevulinate synthase [Archangium sp.]